MDIIDIINKKKFGKILSKEEIDWFVQQVCSKSISESQIASMLMAMFTRGLNFDETYNLTMAMARSGEMLNLDDIGICFDKHSTGGVSDTTTLVVVPVLASLGVKVAKMSGRSLGWTGGTADKMEVFKGYKTEISIDEFKKLILQNNASIVSPTEDLALADKILYKLRSETATVDSLPLIASSIMSKKIACGAKLVILDVKYGSGAFMKTLKDAKKLARTMVDIGKKAGLKVCAVISNMNQPLTKYVGNNFEVYSALQVLNGEENNLSKLSAAICVKALLLLNRGMSINEAKEKVNYAIKSGDAKKKLKDIISAQGGSIDVIDNSKLLFPKNNKFEIYSNKCGYVNKIDTSLLGYIAHDLQNVNGKIVRQDDVGIVINKEVGQKVDLKESLMTVYYNKLDDIEMIKQRLSSVFEIGLKPHKTKLIDSILE